MSELLSRDINAIPEGCSRIVFLGTGSSTGLPHPFHLMNPDPPTGADEKAMYAISLKASVGDPAFNKNYRCNPSLLIQYHKEDTSKITNVIIDCGKTFRESIIRWFPRFHVNSVDGIILTHGHADAIFGLDDVRSIQPRNVVKPMDVFLSQECHRVVAYTFPYLFPDESRCTGVHRHVASIKWNEFNYFDAFFAADLLVTPLPVMHGEDMFSSAFIFGDRQRVCYISDISRMLPDTLLVIKSAHIDFLIVDALCLTFEHPTHYSLNQAIDLCRDIKPSKAYFVGMSSQFDHDTVNDTLKLLKLQEDLDLELAHDGLCFYADL